MELSNLIDNRTPMRARSLVMADPQGVEQLVTIAKMTWQVDSEGRPRIGYRQSPVRLSDAYFDGPGTSLRYPADFFESKPGTDVVLLGTATPPAGVEVSSIDVSLRILPPAEAGEVTPSGATPLLDKTLRVYGTRVWQRAISGGIMPGPAAPLKPTALRYENSYGGSAVRAGQDVRDARNPIGRGAFSANAEVAEQLLGQRTPSIEDPARPLLPSADGAVAGFGPIASSWQPRSAFMGTYDEAYRKERFPLRPLDFDTRFHCCGPVDQQCAMPLSGSEVIAVGGVKPHGTWSFQLPRYRPVFHVQLADESESRSCGTHLDTLLIDADSGRVELTWRCRFPLPRKAERIHWVRIASRDQLDAKLLRALQDDIQAAKGAV